MAIGEVITVKGEQATVIVETYAQRKRVGIHSAQLLQLNDSKMYVVIRNGFIQWVGSTNATADLKLARLEYLDAVGSFIEEC